MNMASDTIGGAVQEQKKFYKMQEMEEQEGARDSLECNYASGVTYANR